MEASIQISYIVEENSTSGAADVKRIFCGLASRWFLEQLVKRIFGLRSKHQADEIGLVVSSTTWLNVENFGRKLLL